MKYVSFFLSISIITMTLCRAAESPQRVRPPRWSQDVLDAFFEDAREHLVGERPRHQAKKWAAQPRIEKEQATDGASKWSDLIEAETLTAEIKRVFNQLTPALKKSTSFQVGGNLICQRDFGLLAVLFSVLEEFDSETRWQRSAKLMQQRCFLAGKNCKAASPQSYSAAKETHEAIERLLRGQAPANEAASQEEDGPGLVERALLMQSMELAIKERLKPVLANAREFRKRSQLALEQSQLLAVLAEVIQQEGYEYADDDTYLDEARQLGKAAEELSQAARDKNYEAARTAAGKLGQSCSRCHEGYRG